MRTAVWRQTASLCPAAASSEGYRRPAAVPSDRPAPVNTPSAHWRCRGPAVRGGALGARTWARAVWPRGAAAAAPAPSCSCCPCCMDCAPSAPTRDDVASPPNDDLPAQHNNNDKRAFSLLIRRLSTRHCPHLLQHSAVARCRSISPARGALSSKPAARRCCCRSTKQSFP